jgi:hypothetical protein
MTEDKNMLVMGDIVQVNPDVAIFGACLVVVSEVTRLGIQGYVQSAGVDSQHHIRLRFAEFELTGGNAAWVLSKPEIS